MANEFIIKNGFHSKGDSNITGSLGITGISDVSASIAAAGGSTPTLNEVITAGASATGDVSITGSLIISGSANVFKFDQTALIIGQEAGDSLTSFSVDNTMLGRRAGYQTSTGDQNVFVGDQAGYIGDHLKDVAVGYQAGTGYTGGDNVSIGYEAGRGAAATSAEKHNTQIGSGAGRNNWRGSGNTFIGYRAGFNGYDNEGCIIIGSGSVGQSSAAAGGLTQQLRIGNGSIHAISGSLETGDVIFYNTASAPLFSGSFVGNFGDTTSTVTAKEGAFGTGTTTIDDNINTTGNITASGDISSSATSTASFGTYLGDGSQLTGTGTTVVANSGTGDTLSNITIDGVGYDLTTGTVTPTNGASNRIATFNNATLINGEANLTFDGSALDVTGDITASGAILLPNSAQSVNFLNQSGIHSRTGGSYPGFNIASGTGTGNRIWLSDTLGTPLSGAGTGAVTMSFVGLGRITNVQTIEPNSFHPLILRGGPTPNDNNDGVRIQTADASNVYIDRFQIESDSANVDAYFHNINGLGINQTSPSSTLDVSGNINTTSHITASGNVSSSAASTASFGTYLGDGSNLTGTGTVVTGNGGGSGDTLSSINIGGTDFTVATGTGNGTVDTTGTPANNQVAVFTDGNTIEGTSSFSYDSSTKELLIGASSAPNTETNTVRIQGYNSSNPALLKLGWNSYGGAALESGFNGTLNVYNYGSSATDGGRLVLGQAGDTGTNQTNYLWIRGDNADDSTHIYMGANSITYSSEIGIERAEGTGVNYESDISLRAAAGLSQHKSEYIFSRNGMFQAQDAGFTVSGSGQVFIGGFSGSIDQTTNITGYDQSLAVSGSAIIESSGSNIFKVEGSVGTLFSVDDGLDDVIFAANNISGTPVISANADNTVKLGKLGGFGIVISGSTPAPNDDQAKIIITGSMHTSGSLGVGMAASSTVGRIDANNDVVAFSTSDERLKDNIVPIEDALNKVSQVQGIEFDWIPKEGVHGNEGRDVGVIAQEIEKVLPEVVTTRDNGYKAVKYEKIIPLLVEAIKELQEEIKELKKDK